MEFFRDLGLRFEALNQSDNPHSPLESNYHQTSYRRRAEEFGGLAATYAQEVLNPDRAAEYAKAAFSAASVALDGDGTWSEYEFRGGPSDRAMRQVLIDRWSALAQIGAARYLGPVSAAVDAWLRLLRERSPYCHRFVEGDFLRDRIKDLCTASARLCEVLEGEEANRSAPAPERELRPATAQSEVATIKPAATLQERIDEFLVRAGKERGERLPENYIWKTLCGYKDDGQFRQWKQGRLSPRSKAARVFERALACKK